MSTLARLSVAALASGLVGCASAPVAPPPVPNAALPASHTPASSHFAAYPSTRTRGEVRVTLVSVGRTTRFLEQSVLDDKRRGLSPTAGALRGPTHAVPCVEIEYVVEYLADVPVERRVYGTPTVFIDGDAEGRRSGGDNWPRRSGVIVEMLHFFARPGGFPEVERPERAVYRQLIVWGMPESGRRLDFEISEGTVDQVEPFRFEAIPLAEARQ